MPFCNPPNFNFKYIAGMLERGGGRVMGEWQPDTEAHETYSTYDPLLGTYIGCVSKFHQANDRDLLDRWKRDAEDLGMKLSYKRDIPTYFTNVYASI